MNDAGSRAGIITFPLFSAASRSLPPNACGISPLGPRAGTRPRAVRHGLSVNSTTALSPPVYSSHVPLPPGCLAALLATALAPASTPIDPFRSPSFAQRAPDAVVLKIAKGDEDNKLSERNDLINREHYVLERLVSQRAPNFIGSGHHRDRAFVVRELLEGAKLGEHLKEAEPRISGASSRSRSLVHQGTKPNDVVYSLGEISKSRRRHKGLRFQQVRQPVDEAGGVSHLVEANLIVRGLIRQRLVRFAVNPVSPPIAVVCRRVEHFVRAHRGDINIRSIIAPLPVPMGLSPFASHT